MSNNTASNTASDKKTIKELVKLIEETSLTEIEYETEAFRVRLARGSNNYNAANLPPQPILVPPQQPVQSATQLEQAAAEKTEKDYEHDPNVVKSPMVGVVYLAPEPGAPTYVKEGDTVTADQTLLLVEAMKTFNPVKAPKSGKVTKILASDNMPVEFGEPLLVVE